MQKSRFKRSGSKNLLAFCSIIWYTNPVSRFNTQSQVPKRLQSLQHLAPEGFSPNRSDLWNDVYGIIIPFNDIFCQEERFTEISGEGLLWIVPFCLQTTHLDNLKSLVSRTSSGAETATGARGKNFAASRQCNREACGLAMTCFANRKKKELIYITVFLHCSEP